MTLDDFPWLKGDHLMFDLETLGNHFDAVVTSIGACKFTFTGGVTDKFKVNIDPKDAKSYGMKINSSTVDWWKSQSKESIRAWQENPKPLVEALEEFVAFVGDSKYTMWCKGTSFDFPILKNAFVLTGKEAPWNYRQEMDFRTVVKVFNMTKEIDAQNRADTAFHDALGDAVRQANQLIKMFDIEPF